MDASLHTENISYIFFYSEQNDTSEQAVFNIDWNLMPKKEQQMYSILVAGTQNPTLMTIGGLTPLNLATCVQVM